MAMATPAQYLGTGKRKTSVARVILRPGSGATWINGKTIEDYFPRMVHRMIATAPLHPSATPCACRARRRRNPSTARMKTPATARHNA